ncbi:MAG: peroxiredoxin [Polyangiaceae bacterium]|nr:peroxiredoxin [Polyangiaceae bacterium]
MKRSFRIALLIITATLLTLAAFLGCASTQPRPDGGEGLLPVGAAAPDLFAADQNGAIQRLSEQRGRAVVVYFYPKDGTPGCIAEACAFRDAWDRFKAANVIIFGVSADDRQSHETFSKQHNLPFPILADPDQTWITAFGVPTSAGLASRVTFLIGPDGKIAKVYPEVDPGVHADQVLKDAAVLTGAAAPESTSAPSAAPAATGAPSAAPASTGAAPAPAAPSPAPAAPSSAPAAK